jgi:hypothetical protein
MIWATLICLIFALVLFLLAIVPTLRAHMHVVPLGLFFIVLASLSFWHVGLVSVVLRVVAAVLFVLASLPGYQPTTTRWRFTPAALAICTVTAIWTVAAAHVIT